MTDKPASDQNAFGRLHSTTRNQFGLIKGGTRGGGFHALLDEADRERGFFSKTDRELLLKGNWDGELSDATERNARMRIRNRVLSTFFDARYLRYISDSDRDTIFANARDEGNDLHFREGFKEFVRFTYLGLLELDTALDTRDLAQETLETAIAEAEQEHAVRKGERARFEVDIAVENDCERSIEDLEQQYTNREHLTEDDLAVLVSSQHENETADVTSAADIDLADAIYYYARQPEADPHGHTWEEPQPEEAIEVVEWLRTVFDEYDIETYDELGVAVDRLSVVKEDLGEKLRDQLNRLPRLASNFPSQLAVDANLPASDMRLLDDVLWSSNVDIETALEEEIRPRTAGDGWDPTEDENLQKFIARVEVAREMNSRFTLGTEKSRVRWDRLRDLADFDEDEMRQYMQEQRASRLEDALQETLDQTDLTHTQLRETDSLEDLIELLYESGTEDAYWLAMEYEDPVVSMALESLSSESESE